MRQIGTSINRDQLADARLSDASNILHLYSCASMTTPAMPSKSRASVSRFQLRADPSREARSEASGASPPIAPRDGLGSRRLPNG